MKDIRVMVSGMPGKMASLIAQRAAETPGFKVIKKSLTGPEISAGQHVIAGQIFELVRPEKRNETLFAVKEEYPDLIIVDYTHPTAVNENAEAYCKAGIPFVMGTTGGDREALLKCVTDSGNSAVIAPNMAKQIVGFQAMMEFAADNFPGLFEGYSLTITESHQRTKADTSGTAKAMVGYFKRLGLAFEESDIIQIRDPQVQKESLKIPEEYLDGHGWHTYRLTSADKTVEFEFVHNVNGREIYLSGTLDAVRFLAEKIAEKKTGKVFTMIDVLMKR